MKFLVVGCGSIGRRHIRNLLDMGHEVIAVETFRPRWEQAKRDFGIKTFSNIADGLFLDPDAVLICTPTALHMTDALAAAGRHLFIEKPISHSIDDIDRLIEAQRDRVLLVGCNFRFDPGLQQVKDWMTSIGRPISARIQYGEYLPNRHPGEDYRTGYAAKKELGGGIILDAVHELDYALWLFGEVERSACFTTKSGLLETDTEDMADVLLRFKSGVVASVHVDYLRPRYDRSCEIVGEKGIIQWSFQDKATTLIRDMKREVRVHNREVNDMYIAEMKHFMGCIDGQEKPLLDGRGAKGVLELALQLKKGNHLD